jgi:hypothetical protein
MSFWKQGEYSTVNF